MTMTFSADASGNFGTIAINGVGQIEVYNDGTLKSVSTGKVIGTAQGIVGLVSQSGGVPTGAIIERDSNANGEYVMLADGTLICSRFISTSESTTTAVANVTGMFQGASQTWTYPASFITTPEYAGVSGGRNATDTNFAFVSTLSVSSGSSMTYKVINNFNSASFGCNKNFLSIGRWF